MSHDDEMLARIKSTLPYDGSIDFVRENRCCGRDFNDRKLNDLYLFMNLCRDPSFAFKNENLEHLRLKLRDKIQTLLGTIGHHYTRGINRQELEFHRYDDKEYVERVWAKLEGDCDAVFAAYEGGCGLSEIINLPNMN